MKFFALLALSFVSFSAFSQTCYVDMIEKRSGRVVRSFTAYGDANCMEGMKQCRKSIRLDYSSSPQYPNGSLDCVAAGDYGPQPVPTPYPTPAPLPPGRPTPPPSYRSIEANEFILNLMSSSSTSETQTKMAEAFVSDIQSYGLSPLVRVCASTRTWFENASCLTDGLRRAPREVIDEGTAIFATGRACTLTKTWFEEQSCFSAATRSNRLPSLGYLAQSCANMVNSESSARCYRSIFNVQ